MMNRRIACLVAVLAAGAGLMVLLLMSGIPVQADPGDVVVDRATGVDQPNCGNGINPPCYSIKYAVENVAAAGDSVLVAAGTYTETFTMQPGVDVVSQSGQEVTIIDGEYVRGPMVSAVGATITPAVRLEGFTITGGHASWLGGAVFVDDGASMVISDTWLISNTADTGGGGISLIDGASLLLYECTLEQNSRSALRMDNNASATILHSAFLTNTHPSPGSWGGGIIAQNNCTLVISSTLFQNNYASHGGGVMAADCVLNLFDSEFYSNTAGGGGAIHVRDGSTFDVRDNTIEHNEARGAGGIGIYGGSGGASNGTIASNTLCNNRSTDTLGGAISVSEGATVAISGNLIISNSVEGQGGAGIYVYGYSTNVSIFDNTIMNNVADHGTGIFVGRARVEVISNTITHNEADAGGGAGIRVEDGGNGLISGNQILSNTATGTAGGLLLNSAGQIEVQDNIIAYNTGDYGTAISVRNGYGGIHSNQIHHNTTRPGGSGRAVYLWSNGSADLDVHHNWITDNEDGALELASTGISVTNNIIAHNSGGIAEISINQHDPTVANNTIVGDGASNGIEIKNTGAPTITNNIISNAAYGIRNTSSETSALGHNNVWNNTTGNYSGIAPGTNDISCDPDFVDAAADDYHLGICSCAVDAGTNTGAPASDYDGDARPMDGDGDGTATVDIGADERLTVTAPLPVAGYSYSTVGLLAVSFANTSENAVSHEWDFGDGVGFSTTENPTYTYSLSGTYPVTLTAICAFGCRDSFQDVVTVQQFSVYLPFVVRGSP